MRTLSTGYQRPHPRIITRSCPFHLLTATTDPSGQLTCVVPRKACSTRAALIWRTLVDCMCYSSFGLDWVVPHTPYISSCSVGSGVGAAWGAASTNNG